MFLQLGAIQVFSDGLVRRRLAGEDEAAACIEDRGNDRLAGKQIVTEKDRPEVSEAGAVPGQRALRGVAFAIRPLRAILRRDEFWRQRQDLPCRWPGATRLASRKARKYSVPPSERRRVEHCSHLILREQKCSVPLSAIATRPARHWNGVSGPAASIALMNKPIERLRRGTVPRRADVVVRGDRRHAEQRLAVRPAVSLRLCPLMPKERRASHEEDRESRQADVGHRVVAVTPRPLALVRQTGADLAQRPKNVRETHPACPLVNAHPVHEILHSWRST
jgi:hypothetical protein